MVQLGIILSYMVQFLSIILIKWVRHNQVFWSIFCTYGQQYRMEVLVKNFNVTIFSFMFKIPHQNTFTHHKTSSCNRSIIISLVSGFLQSLSTINIKTLAIACVKNMENMSKRPKKALSGWCSEKYILPWISNNRKISCEWFPI